MIEAFESDFVSALGPATINAPACRTSRAALAVGSLFGRIFA
jgi:hypothetical protein